MFDKPDDKIVVFTRADHCDARVIGKDNRHWRSRIFGPAIAWCAGAWAVGNLVIAGLCPGIGIRARLCEEVVDLPDHSGRGVGAVNDHGIIDSDLLGKNLLTRPDAAVLGQNVFQVRTPDKV